ncbi:transposase [Bifidobacterium breve]|uniref:transposase n=1 Tax=Bifidobacterium breve TaxID=1685 RepID=UPI001F448CA5|nr:transposase [Bifidobacterium breve]
MGGLGEVHALLGQQAHVLGPPGLAHRLPRRITVPLEHPAAGPCPVVMVARGHLILPAVGQVLQRSLELAMDRAYEGGDSIRLLAESSGLTPVVPPKKNRTDPWDYDRQAYKGRNVVERVFNRMKHHRKAATRYDRLDETFLANLQLILIAIYLKKHSQKPN